MIHGLVVIVQAPRPEASLKLGLGEAARPAVVRRVGRQAPPPLVGAEGLRCRVRARELGPEDGAAESGDCDGRALPPLAGPVRSVGGSRPRRLLAVRGGRRRDRAGRDGARPRGLLGRCPRSGPTAKRGGGSRSAETWVFTPMSYSSTLVATAVA